MSRLSFFHFLQDIYKQKALLQVQQQEFEQAREEFKQDELDFSREKMRVFVQSGIYL